MIKGDSFSGTQIPNLKFSTNYQIKMSDVYKRETYNTLTAMGYSYALVDKAYKMAPIKTTEGVINYIHSNPNLHIEVEKE